MLLLSPDENFVVTWMGVEERIWELDPTCHNYRSCVPQLRPDTAKEITFLKKKEKGFALEGVPSSEDRLEG